ncbi:unnamed protein product [Cylindrotheca closterium]|uniref:Hexosyltransferase n=1 Tax=Cylindrotheca closterium TaxID=2856 RepID=A0AAD2CRQ6_9STRA|nr:unnamed protein product [Cylindrotheca closterium]
MRGKTGVAALLAISLIGINLLRRGAQLSTFLAIVPGSAITSTEPLPGLNDGAPKQGSAPRRILMGIIGVGNKEVGNTRLEGRRRRIIRETYLKHLGSFNTSYRVCSISKLISKKETADNCEIIYTFVIATKGVATNLNNMKKSKEKLRKNKGEYEPDKIFIKVKKPENKYQATQAWLSAAKQIQVSTASTKLGQFDYIMSLSTDLMIQPQEFWEENAIFFTSNETSNLAASYKESILFLSKDFAIYFSDKKPASLSQGIVQYQRETRTNMSVVKMGGIKPATGVPVKTLADWDKYINPKVPMFEKDLVENEGVSYSNKTQYSGMPRMLFGIFTTNLKAIERERRDTLRSTYLSFYNNSETPHRICSLQQLLRNEVKDEDCQIAYTFVVGANRNGPTSRVEANATESMVIPASTLKDAEDDVLYLDIKENMEEGKSDTWFRFGYLLSETLYFDYIAKADTDTVVYPPSFVRDLKRMPMYPWNKRIFGGKYDIRFDYPTKYRIVGPTFMSGLLYWMSPDLASYITDPEQCNRKKYHAPFEDLNIANLIHTHPQMIRRVQMSYSSIDHPVKNVGDFKTKWKKYLKAFTKN